MPDASTYLVAVQTRPAWLVGETDAEAHARRAAAGPRSDLERAREREDHYGNDYAGRVKWVKRPEDARADDRQGDELREVREMELGPAEAAALRSRAVKLAGGAVAGLTPEDRFGACAAELRRLFPDLGDAIVDEPEREQARLEAWQKLTRLAEDAYLDEIREWKEASAEALLVRAPLPPKPEPPEPEPPPAADFSEALARIASRLPPTKTHTGAGLYNVKASFDNYYGQMTGLTDNGDGTYDCEFSGFTFGSHHVGGYVNNTTRSQTRTIVAVPNSTTARVTGDCSTWSTGDWCWCWDAWDMIQSALDQLWADQGSAAFTASQFTRVFAGTYDENVEPNAGLVPDITNGFALVVEGDPADSRANVILAPTSGNNAFATKLQHTLVRHMTIDGTAGIAQHTMVATANGYVDPLLEVRDCVVTQGAGADMYAITCPTKSHLLAVDCSISTDGHGINANSWQYYSNGLRVEGCTITRTGAKGGAGIYFWMGGVVRGCVVDGFENGICPANGAYTTAVLENNTVYDCTYAFYFNQGMRDADLVNNIADSCDYAVRVSCWPDEASDTFGGPFTLRNNCWNHGTAFAYDGAGTKTHAQFAALDRVDESGDLDATDPLLTNPASGDYTLQAASPCRRRGHGSGVVSDYQGNAYCPNHPDIGASSTGTSTSAPSITAVAPSASSVVVTVTAGGGPREVAVLVDATGSEIDRQSRLGAGTIALTPSAAGSHFVAAWGADAGDAIIGEPDTWHGQVVVPASGAVTATGPLSLVLENLRTLLANSSTFQSLVGVGDAASAKAFIHYPAADSASWTRPRALIDHLAPSPEHENVGRGSGNTFGESGEAEIVIEASIGTNYRADRQEENAYLEFANKVGAIASEMKGLAGTSGYLDATRFGFTLARGDDDEEAVGAHWYRAEIEIGWGR